MSEYTAVMIGAVAIMLFWGWLSFKLGEDHDGIKIFLLLSSFVMSWAVANLGIQIISTITPSAALLGAESYVLYLSVAVGVLVMIYFALYLVMGTARAAVKKRQSRMMEGEE